MRVGYVCNSNSNPLLRIVSPTALQHTTGKAFVRLEWSRRTDTRPSVIPTENLYHLRLGYKMAVDLLPAPTAASRSTVIWLTTKSNSTATSTATTAGNATKGVGDTAPREVIAGATFEIVVEARDAYGNARGIGEARSKTNFATGTLFT